MKAGALALLCCSLLACGSKFQPEGHQPLQRGPYRAPGQQPQASSTAAPEPAQPLPTAFPTPAPAQPAPAQPVEKPEPEPEKRDYAAELLGALGSPIDCLKPRRSDDAPPEIQIDLEAHFLSTGTMSRGYARSAQLEDEELECVRRRLSAVSLRPPISDAPREVQATLRIKLKNPVKSTE